MKKEEIYFSDLLEQLDVLMAYCESDGRYSKKGHMALECYMNKMLDFMDQERKQYLYGEPLAPQRKSA